MTNQAPLLPPGFRFHPTDEELILFYLKNRSESTPCPVSIIAEVDIYKFDPWNLPDMAMFGDKEWYFFTPRDRKYPNGVRPNRAAGSGYWKATGTDKPIMTSTGNENVGVKKALVFYIGKPPKGRKTNWIMHEYRLSENNIKNSINRPTRIRNSSMRLDDWVLCRIYQKGGGHVKEEDSIENESSFEDNKLELQRSISLSELLNEADFSLLSRFIETPVDAGMQQQHMQMNAAAAAATTYAKAEPSVYVSNLNYGLKRQRGEEGENSMYPMMKKDRGNSSWDYMNFGDDQYDSQTFFDQQLLMNSQFGMQ